MNDYRIKHNTCNDGCECVANCDQSESRRHNHRVRHHSRSRNESNRKTTYQRRILNLNSYSTKCMYIIISLIILYLVKIHHLYITSNIAESERPYKVHSRVSVDALILSMVEKDGLKTRVAVEKDQERKSNQINKFIGRTILWSCWRL